jgi:integrase
MLYKRGRSWSYKFKWTVKSNDGSRETFVIRKSARTKNCRKAQEAEEEHRRAIRLGLVHPRDPWPKPPPPQAPSLRVFKDRFIEYTTQHTKLSTAVFYEECINRILRFSRLSEAPLTAVTGELVANYTTWRRSQISGNSVSSINAELRTLRRMFSLAEEWGIVEKAPAIHELPGQRIRDRVVSFYEEAKYLATACPTLHDLAVLAVDTGLRPDSELFPLEWKNVQLGSTEGAPSGYLHVGSGKTENAVRNMPLTPRVKAILQARHSGDPSGRFVFPGSGRSGHITTIQNAHRRAIKRAKLAHFEFYCWRHTFGTRCAESGMDKFSLARLMGHSSPRIAERYYIHVSERHVNVGFERFVEYQTMKQAEELQPATNTIQ